MAPATPAGAGQPPAVVVADPGSVVVSVVVVVVGADVAVDVVGVVGVVGVVTVVGAVTVPEVVVVVVVVGGGVEVMVAPRAINHPFRGTTVSVTPSPSPSVLRTALLRRTPTLTGAPVAGVIVAQAKVGPSAVTVPDTVVAPRRTIPVAAFAPLPALA